MTRIIPDISVSLDGFVTTGLPDAVTAARERAEAASSGSGKDLGAPRALVQQSVVSTSTATHLTYDISR